MSRASSRPPAAYPPSARGDGLAVRLDGGIEATVAIGDQKVRIRETQRLHVVVPGLRSTPKTGGLRSASLTTAGRKARQLRSMASGSRFTLRAAMRRSIEFWSKATSLRLVCRCRPNASSPIRACGMTSASLRDGGARSSPPRGGRHHRRSGPEPRIARSASIEAEWREDLFGGVMALTASAKRLAPGDSEEALYSTTPPTIGSTTCGPLSSALTSRSRFDAGCIGQAARE